MAVEDVDGDKKEDAEAARKKVLDKLDDLGKQLNSLANGQKMLQGTVSKIYQELQKPPQPGALERAGSAPIARQASSVAALRELKKNESEAFPHEGGRKSVVPLDMESPRITPPQSAFAAGTPTAQSTFHELAPRPSTSNFSMNANDSYRPFKGRALCCGFSPIHPDSKRRAIWDFICMLALLYDSVMLPYQLAFDVHLKGFLLGMAWVIFFLWCIDLVLGFVTGYHIKDELVMDMRMINKHYVMTTFIPNLAVVIADLIGNIIDTRAAVASVGEGNVVVKLARFVKLNRLVRIASSFHTGKFAQSYDLVVTVLRRWGFHEHFNFMMRVCKLVLYIIWANHLGCCLWRAVGKDAVKDWYAACTSDFCNSEDRSFDYFLNFYWSASAMIAGDSIMNPTNSVELILTIFFVVIGFIFSSALISSLLGTVMDYQMSNKERYEKLNTLRQFLFQHNVDTRLSMPIQKQVKERISSSKRLSEKDVQALALLSPTLRAELWNAIYGPSIGENAFIHTCDILVDSFIKDLCFCAMLHMAHQPGVRVFEPEMESTAAIYVYWGSLEYLPHLSNNAINTRSDGVFRTSGEVSNHLTGSDDSVAFTTLYPGEWVSELALWTEWFHRGWLEAATPCELLLLQAEPFKKVIAGHPDLVPLAQHYSTALLASIGCEPQDSLTDLSVVVDHASVVAAMPIESRVLMSQAALDVLRRKTQWSGHLFQHLGMEELTTEVQAGDCDLVVDKQDRVHRVVCIVAVKLVRRDGCILTQIGKVTKGSTVPSCTLPGTKVKVGELPQDAIERLLGSKLKLIRDGVELGGRSVDEEERVSKKYGVPSKYRRTLFKAVLHEGSRDMGTVIQKAEQTSPEPAQPPTVDLAAEYEAFYFENDLASNTVFIYAWLRATDFEVLTKHGSDSPGDTLAGAWLRRLAVDVSLAQGDSAATLTRSNV